MYRRELHHPLLEGPREAKVSETAKYYGLSHFYLRGDDRCCLLRIEAGVLTRLLDLCNFYHQPTIPRPQDTCCSEGVTQSNTLQYERSVGKNSRLMPDPCPNDEHGICRLKRLPADQQHHASECRGTL
jgi:hypothetical protein